MTICATTNEGKNIQVVRDFSVTETVKTDNYIVSYDAAHNKILRIKTNNGNILLKEFNLNYTFKNWNIVMKNLFRQLRHIMIMLSLLMMQMNLLP